MWHLERLKGTSEVEILEKDAIVAGGSPVLIFQGRDLFSGKIRLP